MKNLIYIIFLFLSISVFLSCEDKDDFSSDSNLNIEFSSDTIRFDTVFTSFGSSTRKMKIYNRNKNSLVINSIELMNPEQSGFRIMVPPYSGNSVNNVEILKKDSVYIYIEVTVDPQNSNSPILIQDSIRLQYNGNTQYIQLEAYGQDAFIWRGKTIEQDTTLTGEKPILIFDSLVVNKEAKLSIEPNTRMFFHKNAGVKVYGTIDARGTLNQPIVMRGDRTDNIFTKVPYDRVPGQWNGMTVDSLSFNNHFEYFHLRNSIQGIMFKTSNLSQKKATFINSIIHNTTSDGVSAENCQIEGYNSQFTNAGGSVLKLIGGDYYFLHCTLANNISPRWGVRINTALLIGNYSDDKETRPLIRGEFINSIISESGSSAVKEQKSDNSGIPYNRSFRNCLVKAKGGKDDEIDKNNIWNEDPVFVYVSNKKLDYYYNFELDSISPAKNVADKVFSISLPLDIKGESRLGDDGPDIGCYEWIPTQTGIQ